jgi:hypothetical protein
MKAPIALMLAYASIITMPRYVPNILSTEKNIIKNTFSDLLKLNLAKLSLKRYFTVFMRLKI